MSDSDYFLERAEAEIALAQSARHEAACRAHYELAGYYLDRVYGPDACDVPVMKRNAQ